MSINSASLGPKSEIATDDLGHHVLVRERIYYFSNGLHPVVFYTWDFRPVLAKLDTSLADGLDG